ncbi:hypothetical protein AYI70_g3939 [Smittium culicis]|uniref:Uncharacterized protein n=1 Tax=Smittium culicis TaxID=133412 RepID=A0A1R1Y1X8_9FUNG|nr:hypothetical protein AYI70_g3939 [Smittium culicis]
MKIHFTNSYGVCEGCYNELRSAKVSLKNKGIYLIRFPRMRKVDLYLSDCFISLIIRDFRGKHFEFFEMLRRLHPKVVMIQESFLIAKTEH